MIRMTNVLNAHKCLPGQETQLMVPLIVWLPFKNAPYLALLGRWLCLEEICVQRAPMRETASTESPVPSGASV
jgi:hypothetical protein